MCSALTSNCQCAACKSCFAWSAAHPAVRTNWFIITWCLSSSISAGVCFRATSNSVSPGMVFLRCSLSAFLFQPSTITAGWANTNIYCRSAGVRSARWLTARRGQSERRTGHGNCMPRESTFVVFFKTALYFDTRVKALDVNVCDCVYTLWNFLFNSDMRIYKLHDVNVSTRWSGSLNIGTAYPVMQRFVCWILEGRIYEWRPLPSNSNSSCATTFPNMVNKSCNTN